MTELLRQHLIDPEVCIRCNTCEETCPVDAITHNARNYAVLADKCDACGDCLPPCPTGAIDSWRHVRTPHSIEEQLAWEELPKDQSPQESVGAPEGVEELTRAATQTSGPTPPPWSAAHPYVNLYTLERPAIATVAGSYRLTDKSSDVDIRHIVLDFGKNAFPVLEGQSIGVIPPGVDASGKPHHVRLYSVASPRDGERPKHNNLALTVKRVTVDHDGNPVQGVASSYLCDLEKGAQVKIVGPYGTSFLMPNHPGSRLLLVCTGTGAAPMRAMTERRRRRMALQEGSDILLFFGARRREELPYFGPLMRLPRELIEVELAFSRAPDRPKEYVQDRMRARHERTFEMLSDPESYVYVCGHKRMEEGVLGAFADICKKYGADWTNVYETMRREGRFHMETY